MKRDRITTLLLFVITLMSIGVHCLVNHRYGFHRDEFPVIDDALHLAWGYPAYPPVTPFIASFPLALFGPSLVGLRLFSALGFGIAIVFSGLIARELGAGRWGQMLAAATVAIAPVPLHNSSLFQYVTWDYLAWVLCAYFIARRCRSGDPRWWLAIGASIAFGLLSKYTMGLFVAGFAVAIFLTPLRRDLASKWLWLGALLCLVLVLPHLIWEIQHDYVSLDFLRHIRARDYRQGRTSGFFPQQLLVGANLITIPLWLLGLWFYLLSKEGKPFRVMGWLYLVLLILFFFLHGRSYYLAPAYPMLLAAGSCVWSRVVARFHFAGRATAIGVSVVLLIVGGIEAGRILMPVAQINSPLWQRSIKLVDDFAEETGWPELADAVAAIYHAQPVAGRTAILCGNYGEAGSLNLYGPARNLPTAISGVNSYWARGYGQPDPDRVVLVGFTRGEAERGFAEVTLAGHITNPFGIRNEESHDHPDIFVCRYPRLPWPELWQRLRGFG